MTPARLRLFLVLAICLLLAAAVQAQVDPFQCNATTQAAVQVTVTNYPNGAGDVLSAAQPFGGGSVNATITVTVRDGLGLPVVGYPAENVELATYGGSSTFVTCPLGAIADGPSDVNGEMTFSGALAAGGYSDGDMAVVLVEGVPLDWDLLDILFNSPDLDFDLDVDDDDNSVFLGDQGSGNHRSDFVWNGAVGLEDISEMGAAFGAVCDLAGIIEIDVWPDLLGVSWTLEGPSSFLLSGSEDLILPDMEPGTYTLTYDPLNCYTSPSPNPDVQVLPASGTILFVGDYVPYGTIWIDPEPNPPTLTVNWKLYGSAPFDTLFGSGDFNICLPPDDYTLAWQDEAGWYHDCTNPEVQTVLAGAAITFTCQYHEYATIDVDPEPDSISAPWTLTGPSGYNRADNGDVTVADLRPGSYSLTWGAVPGWYMPCTSPQIIVVTNGDYVLASCTYLEEGQIDIDTEPDAISAGWSITGPFGYSNSGNGDASLLDLPPGTYNVTWQPVPCWTEPAPNPQVVNLPGGGHETALGTYLENGTITVDAEPDIIDAPWHLTGPAGFDHYGTADSTLTCMSPGEYTLTWLDVPGWILSCPDPVVQTLPPAGTINFACTYGEAGTIVINPDPDSLDAGWHLTGPASFDTTGTGDATLLLKPAGTYTLTWDDMPYWVEPVVNPDIQTLVPEGTVNFDGLYETLPEILSIVDVDGDQGRRVRIVWRRSLFDAPGDTVEVSGYGIYRRQDAYKGLEIPTGPRDPENLKMLGWDALGMVPARMDSAYQYVAETLCDSTVTGGQCWSVFMISAVTPSAAVFFDSRPDSGYSLDNLAPMPPGGLAADYEAGVTALDWDANHETDLHMYRVYRAPVDLGAPGGCGARPAQPTVEIGSDAWTDNAGGWDYCYYVTAVDHAGNESPATVWSEASVSGTPDGGIPSVVALHHNVPNPFNPMTTISYDLPASSAVRLVIYDASGRLVRVLVDESSKEPGRHQEVWNGRDRRDQRVAAGVYFYRLETRDFQATRSMVLLK